MWSLGSASLEGSILQHCSWQAQHETAGDKPPETLRPAGLRPQNLRLQSGRCSRAEDLLRHQQQPSEPNLQGSPQSKPSAQSCNFSVTTVVGLRVEQLVHPQVQEVCKVLRSRFLRESQHSLQHRAPLSATGSCRPAHHQDFASSEDSSSWWISECRGKLTRVLKLRYKQP